MIFWSWVIVMVSIPGAGGRGAVPARGENRAPPPGTHFETNNDCQIKCKLLQLRDARQERFTFLGYSFGPHWYKANGQWYLGTSPSKKSVQRLKTTWQPAGARQQRPMAGSARHAEQISARLVELLLLRDAPVSIPQC